MCKKKIGDFPYFAWLQIKPSPPLFLWKLKREYFFLTPDGPYNAPNLYFNRHKKHQLNYSKFYKK